MKFLLFIIALCAMQTTYAQKIINKSVTANDISDIYLETEYADIQIESYNGNEIILEASVNINLNMDNEAFKIDSHKSGSQYSISTSLDTDNIPKRIIMTDQEGNSTVVMGENASFKDVGDKKNYSSINYGYQTDIVLLIKVPHQKNIRVQSTYGGIEVTGKYNDVNIDITYGDIDIVHTDIKYTSSVELHTTYGHVDYSIPKTSDIEFNLSTSYGEILTDLDVTSANKDPFKGNNCQFGQSGKYTLNGGNTIANISATYDNIYLRGN